MSQSTLTVATRANHAALLPVVLIATSINEARPTPVITINYEDSAVLEEGEKAIVQLTTDSKSVFGTIQAVEELRSQFPYLASKDISLVSRPAIN